MKANVCPFTVRLAWHASGTYDKNDGTGGSDGATMRFEPEMSDGANAGLKMVQDILEPIKQKFPQLSYADIWTVAGVEAIKASGGPDIPFHYGRTDADASEAPGVCPANGRLPAPFKDAQHLRDVFYRMGFDDRGIVALSGAHTLGSCHESRSGFDGPWTTQPLKFDNEYFKNLLDIEWTVREWDGPKQYTDPSGKLMLLPTDMALKTDPEFLVYVKQYANDEELFFKDFAEAFGKLIALGCPAHVQPDAPVEKVDEKKYNKDFRDLAMHGSLHKMKKIAADNQDLDANAKEPASNRAAIHKAAYFGHEHVIDYLISEFSVPIDLKDSTGETPLHDCCRFGHESCVKKLLEAGADVTIKNNVGETPLDVAIVHKQASVVTLLG